MAFAYNKFKVGVMVRFRILERISTVPYIYEDVGTVGRPFPTKTYHYQGQYRLASAKSPVAPEVMIPTLAVAA